MAVAKQVAAVPIRWNARGKVEVMLVTSRETRRWVVPKGWRIAKTANCLAAANEAWEEAGVRGLVHGKKIGSYTYEKQLKKDALDVKVSVYLLAVTEIADAWPEQRERKRAWFTPAKAAAAVAEPELKELLLSLAV